MTQLHRYAQSLLFPILLLPIITILAFIGEQLPGFFGYFLVQLKAFYYMFLPLLLSASIAFFFSRRNEGTNMLSGILAYIIIRNILSQSTFQQLEESMNVSFDDSFLLIHNAFIGIFCGFVSAFIYNHFFMVQLPQGFAFFSGKRLVPIITGFVMVAISILFYFVWPIFIHLLFNTMDILSNIAIFGKAIFTFFYHLFIVFGLSSLIPINSALQSFLSSIYLWIVPTTLVILYKSFSLTHLKEYRILFILTSIAIFMKSPIFLFEIIVLLIHPLFLLIHILLTSILVLLWSNIELNINIYGIIAMLLYLGCIQLLTYKKPQFLIRKQETNKTVQLEEIKQILEAFGGIENIHTIKEHQSTLEIEVVDPSFVQLSLFTSLGYHAPSMKQDSIYLWEVKHAQIIGDALEKLLQEELEALIL